MSDLRRGVRTWARRVGASAADDRYQAARRAANRRTGRLRQNSRVRHDTSTATSDRYVIEFDEEYASYVDEGTRPHEIRPRRPGGLLVFYWPKVGKVVFLPKVNHPGYKGSQFLTRATRPGEWVRAVRAAAGRIPLR